MLSNKVNKYFFSLFGLTIFTIIFSIAEPALTEEISCLKKLRNIGLDFLYLGRSESDFFDLHKYLNNNYINKNELIKKYKCRGPFSCGSNGYFILRHPYSPFTEFYGAKLVLKDKTIDCELSKPIPSRYDSYNKKSIECDDYLFVRSMGKPLPIKDYFSNIRQKKAQYRVSDIPYNFDQTTSTTFRLQALYFGNQWYKLIAVRDGKILFNNTSGLRWERNIQPKIPSFPALPKNELATNKIGSTITLKTSPNNIDSSGLSYKISCCQDLGSLSSFSVNFLAIPEKYSIYLDEFEYYGKQLLRSSCNTEKIKNKIGIDSIKNMKAHNLLKEKMEDCYKATQVKLKDQLSILLNSDDIIPMNLTINLRTPVQKTNLKF